jgi:hypothetical protein
LIYKKEFGRGGENDMKNNCCGTKTKEENVEVASSGCCGTEKNDCCEPKKEGCCGTEKDSCCK